MVLVIDLWGGVSGTIHGHEYNPGMFIDCVNYRHKSIEGKYCLTQIQAIRSRNGTVLTHSFKFWDMIHDALLSNNVKLTNGVCVPKSCSNFELFKYGNRLLVLDGFWWNDIRCYESPTFDGFDNFAM